MAFGERLPYLTGAPAFGPPAMRTQISYRNESTGEEIVRHVVTDDTGKVVNDHFGPCYKPRSGGLDCGK
jgi:hypothetical protein